MANRNITDNHPYSKEQLGSILIHSYTNILKN